MDAHWQLGSVQVAGSQLYWAAAERARGTRGRVATRHAGEGRPAGRLARVALQQGALPTCQPNQQQGCQQRGVAAHSGGG